MATYKFDALESAMNAMWTMNHKVEETIPKSSISCVIDDIEMLNIDITGFWVRGVKVEQNEKEAVTVYKAFKEFLVWGALSKRENNGTINAITV